LFEKNLIDPAALDAIVDMYENNIGPRNGARVVARAWSDPDYTAELPGLPRDATGPVFAAPWQAQVFALTVQLSGIGCFTWTESADALGAELRQAAERDEPDDGSRYYEHWLAALERLTTAKRLADGAALHARTAARAEAHRATPHWQPVVLGTRGQR
jgi:nitrile hydratase accessory protein